MPDRLVRKKNIQQLLWFFKFTFYFSLFQLWCSFLFHSFLCDVQKKFFCDVVHIGISSPFDNCGLVVISTRLPRSRPSCHAAKVYLPCFWLVLTWHLSLFKRSVEELFWFCLNDGRETTSQTTSYVIFDVSASHQTRYNLFQALFGKLPFCWHGHGRHCIRWLRGLHWFLVCFWFGVQVTNLQFFLPFVACKQQPWFFPHFFSLTWKLNVFEHSLVDIRSPNHPCFVSSCFRAMLFYWKGYCHWWPLWPLRYCHGDHFNKEVHLCIPREVQRLSRLPWMLSILAMKWTKSPRKLSSQTPDSQSLDLNGFSV